MPRWPSNPAKWTPADTEITVPSVATAQCHAEFVKCEDETDRVTRSMWDDRRQEYVKPQRTHWTVTLTCNRQTISSPFSQGSAYDKPPNAEDVLSSLALDASCGSMTFEEFCGDLGYDTDSRSAFDTWQTCRDTELKMRRMFGDKFDAITEWSNER